MKLLSLLSSILFLVGCSAKPEVVTQIEYQEKYVPIRCIDTLPVKPEYDPAKPETFEELMKYFSHVEDLLIQCYKGNK